MPLLEDFLDPENVSLKICGVTLPSDAKRLVEMGVPALGANFWPKSKRYLAPGDADWLKALAGSILRVGVFVNEPSDFPISLYHRGLIDLVQLHGDEKPEVARAYRQEGIPFIKAIGVGTRDDLLLAADYGARAILLDAHAPGVYGGTGEVFDWNVAVDFKRNHPEIPIILAGGIVPDNTAPAVEVVAPAAIDVASGAESAPGIKDFDKVAAYLAALKR